MPDNMREQIKRLAEEADKAFGPLEWFRDFNGDGHLVVSTHWPSFDAATTQEIAEKLNAVLRPYVESAREKIKSELRNL